MSVLNTESFSRVASHSSSGEVFKVSTHGTSSPFSSENISSTFEGAKFLGTMCSVRFSSSTSRTYLVETWEAHAPEPRIRSCGEEYPSPSRDLGEGTVPRMVMFLSWHWRAQSWRNR